MSIRKSATVTFLFFVIFISVNQCVNAENHQVHKSKLNILLILVDDFRHLWNQNVILPNIHKMAAKGVTFKNAFAQQALCAPSRNSMLTGRRPDALHLYDFYSYWRETVGNFTTLPQYFKENGYETYSLGKIFHPGLSSNFTDDFPYSWSHKPFHPPTEQYTNAAVCSDPQLGTLEMNLVCPVNVTTQPKRTLPDLQTLKRAIKILKNNQRDRPLFLAVGFHKPHIPLKYPEEYLDKVPLNKVKPPRQPYMPSAMPLVAWHPWTDVRSRHDISALRIPYPLGTMPEEWTLRIRQSYYAAVTYIDDLIGMLMAHVNRKRTVVVLTSDHGWSLGENGLWAKYSNFDVALRVPLIFNLPDNTRRTIGTPVELLDIFPTLIDLTGIPNKIRKCKNSNDKSTLCFEGKSLAKYMKKNRYYYEKSFDKFAISQYPRPSVYPQHNSDKPRLKDIKIMGYSIRTKRYRYTAWISFNNRLFTRNWTQTYGVELYDHNIDPDESNNMYMNPKYENIKKYLSKLLRSRVDS